MYSFISKLRRLRKPKVIKQHTRRVAKRLLYEALEKRNLLAVVEIVPGLHYDEINRRAESVADGDTVLFHEGLHEVRDLHFSGDVHVMGVPGASVLKAVSGTTLSLTNFEGVVYGLTIIDGEGDIGGNVRVENSNAYFDHVKIMDGYGTIAAAGLAAIGSTVSIADSEISNNRQGRSECNGCFSGTVAAAGAFDNSQLELVRVKVFDNSSWGSGSVGGMRITAGMTVFATPPQSVVIRDSEFYNNSSDNDNGVSVNGATSVSVSNTAFHNASNGIRRNAAIAISNAQDVDIYNNTFHGVEQAVFVDSNVADADIQNNIISNSLIGIEASATHHANYTMFHEIAASMELIGGVTDQPGNKRLDPLFVDANVANFSLQPTSPARKMGNPAHEFDNWDGSDNDPGSTGGTPETIVAPPQIRVSSERLATKAFVLSQFEHKPQADVIPVPILDRLSYQPVVEHFQATTILDEGGFYWAPRPRGSNDQAEQLIYKDVGNGLFSRVGFDDVTVTYGGVVDPATLPPAARKLVRVNYGIPHPTIVSSFPIVFSAGGDAFYGRANGVVSDVLPIADSGTSHRMFGAHNVFPMEDDPPEDFPYAKEVYVLLGDNGEGRLLALFDSAAFTGVLDLTIVGGEATTVQTATTTYIREPVLRAEEPNTALSAQSSMILKTFDDSTTDNARDVEVVKGWFEDGSSIVHIAQNPVTDRDIQPFDLSAHTNAALTKYAVLIVDREPDHFSFFHPRGVHYEYRPSVIVELLDWNVPLRLDTIAQGTTVESDDNYVVLASPREDLLKSTGLEDKITLTTRHIVGAVEDQANVSPRLSDVTDTEANEGDTHAFQLIASDADAEAGLNDRVTYRIVSGQRNGMQLDEQTGSFLWPTTEIDDGEHLIVFEAIDSFGATSNQVTTTITVNEVNTPPEFDDPIDKRLSEGQPISFTLDIRDNDIIAGNPDSLTANVTSPLQLGMTFDPQTTVFSWTPNEAQDGVYAVDFQVTDNRGATVVQTMTITVDEDATSPTLSGPQSRTIDEGILLNIELASTDPDIVAGIADVVMYELTSGDQPGMGLNQTTGRFTWTPNETQDGTHNITFVAHDRDGNASDPVQAIIHVNELNVAPTIEISELTGGSVSVVEGNIIEFTVRTPDSDIVDGLADLVTTTMSGEVAADMAFNASSGSFTWTPDFDEAGTYDLRFTAVDRQSAAATADVTIEVLQSNHPPTEITLSNSQVDENVPGAVIGSIAIADQDDSQLHAIDVSGNIFEVTAGQLKLRDDISLNFENETGAMHDVQITVTDNGTPPETLTLGFTISVQDQNDLPMLTLGHADVDERVQGAVVGKLMVSDEDSNQTHELAIVDSNSPFEIVEVQLDEFVETHLALKDSEFLEYASSANVAVEIQINEVGRFVATSTQILNIGVNENPTPWHNNMVPEDTNGDQVVSPVDVLVIVNVLNADTFGTAQGRLPSIMPAADAHRYDVNNDGYVAPIDALLVINELNAPPAGAEGSGSVSDVMIRPGEPPLLGFQRSLLPPTETSVQTASTWDDVPVQQHVHPRTTQQARDKAFAEYEEMLDIEFELLEDLGLHDEE